MATDIEWEGDLSLGDDLIRVAAKEAPQKRKRVPNSHRFVLGGLIPMLWLERAWSLDRGQYILRAAIIVRHLEALNRGRGASFPFSNVEAARWGISRQMKRLLLNKLEGAGLIAVQRQPGCAPRITVIEVSSGNGAPK